VVQEAREEGERIMYKVQYKNGYFEVTGEFSEIPSTQWLTFNESNNTYYFLPNATTRQLFIRDMLRDPNCFMSREDKDFFRDFTLSQRIDRGTEGLVYPELPNGQVMKDYQIRAVEEMMRNKNFCLFYGPGTGKTLIAISYLNNARPKTVLIITPKKVIKQYTDELLKYCVYMPQVEIINPEQLLAQRNKLLKTAYDCVIVDESHRFKEYTSISSQILRNIQKENCYLFTGTPQDKSRYEIFAQLSLFDQRFMPTKVKFIQRYFEMNQFFQPTTEKHPEELTEMLKLVSFGATTEELIELTSKNEHIIRCERPEIYNVLVKDQMIEHPDFLLVCDTPSKLSIKLRQACNGHLTDDYGVVKEFPSAKEEELYKLAFSLPNGIIYTQFDLDIVVVERVLTKLKRSYCVVNGKTKTEIAEQNISDFKNKKKDFLVIQSASGNAGLDLSMTNNTIFFALPSSFIIFDQCQYRTRRLGQKQDCNYYYLVCSNSVDTHMLSLLRKKKSFNANLYKIYKIKEGL
jgi:SNF2 family DNA or RNA helicase